MKLNQRIQLLAKLGQFLLQKPENYTSVLQKAKSKNGWFTIENQQQAINTIATNYLNEKELNNWVAKYDNSTFLTKDTKVGIICAGNIPLVGIHDLISVFISGHKALLKLSSKDEVLMKFIVETLHELDGDSKDRITIIERLKGHDAVIATGSDNSARYFEYYFKNVPLLLRKNRTSVAVLTGNETAEELTAFADDVFAYFGLGCRNVSKFYIPEGYDVTQIFEAFQHLSELKNNNKYGNNFDYNLALYLINQEPHLVNDFFIMRENEDLFSRLAVVHYQFYKDDSNLNDELNKREKEIQCIVGKHEDYFSFGQAQNPSLWNYADGVDTLAFLGEV